MGELCPHIVEAVTVTSLLFCYREKPGHQQLRYEQRELGKGMKSGKEKGLSSALALSRTT
jgi:hypothetical protein